MSQQQFDIFSCRRDKVRGEVHIDCCTGSLILARTGLLNGQRATTNKRAFRSVRSVSEPEFRRDQDLPITWVPKARWVPRKTRNWTGSGIPQRRILDHLVGEELHEAADDDEFAAYNGLV
ncbi:hypothetical protein B0H13DRAFT_2105230 [Mycena leptocephala]|nr:hypothetical protein B0H13DRAFT_2105230 [Mycena leptocephala]